MPMPPLDRLLETALYVDDPERSAAFYGRVFGFRKIVESHRLIALSMFETNVLLLFRKGASANLPKTPHDGSGQDHLAFAISASEWTHWQEWLTVQKIDIEDDRVWELGGRSLYFRDPDGHLLEVATPGVWAIY